MIHIMMDISEPQDQTFTSRSNIYVCDNGRAICLLGVNALVLFQNNEYLRKTEPHSYQYNKSNQVSIQVWLCLSVQEAQSIVCMVCFLLVIYLENRWSRQILFPDFIACYSCLLRSQRAAFRIPRAVGKWARGAFRRTIRCLIANVISACVPIAPLLVV